MKRSKFNLSYTKLLSCDMGELVPIGLTEVLPGDSIRGVTNALVRAAPMLAPVMHPTDIRIHHWFVPHRLVWSDWEKFITGGPDGLDASVFPTITMPGGGGAAIGSLADYLGVPTGVNSLVVSALPFRGYAKIFNDWYRDQDLVTALALQLTSGPDAVTNTALQVIAWEKDYFTSARPWEQKGASITVPLGTTAPVKGVGLVGTSTAASVAIRETTPLPNRTALMANTFSNANGISVEVDSSGSPTAKPLVFADLSSATGISVNALRASMALQRFQEARSRYGSRYVEYLAALGVRSSDARLDRPEYLGGGRTRLQFSEVLATAEGATTDVADMKGHGIAGVRTNAFKAFFEEHGYIHTFMSIRPKTIYMNGLFKHWNRRTKTDFWQKELQHIGQQAIARKEVYAAAASPDGVFGYQDRYDEYRRAESLVSGEFRSTLLNFWHMARDFGSEPTLNSTFVSSVPTERIFAVPSQDVVYVHARHQMMARRLVSAAGNSFIF